mgnify:FL=1|tara:strand:+ start:13561 stop:14184 length:624 start_codon:yes stop_codon:yes gene_type:complete
MREKNELQDPANDPDRIGCITASDLVDGISGPKGRKTYIRKKAAERMNGKANPQFETWQMERGKKLEAEALHILETIKCIDIIDMPFTKHPKIAYFGASPDGIYEDRSALIEVKCPTTIERHMAVLEGEIEEKRYLIQMQAQLCVFRSEGYHTVDFVSYFPDMTEPEQRIAIVPYRPTKAELDTKESEVKKLDAEIKDYIKKLRSKK